jgi:ribosomal protein L37AE/L43A
MNDMTTEEIKEMEDWCDWACGNCSRTHIKWKAARLGYIRGVYVTKQNLNKHGVSGKPQVCPDCQTKNLHHMGHGAWCCAFCGSNGKPVACASGAVDKTVSVDLSKMQDLDKDVQDELNNGGIWDMI